MAERTDFPRPGSNWFNWAEEVVAYFKNPLPTDREVLPSVILLRHQVTNELARALVEGLLMYDPVKGLVVVSDGSIWAEIPKMSSGTWTGTIEDNSVRGVGNVSSTTAVGTFDLIGNIMHLTIEFLNISIAGLTAGNSAFIHGVALVPAVSDFTLVPNATSAFPTYVDDIIISNLFQLTSQLTTVITTAGYIILREMRSAVVSPDVLVSQINGGDIYINGSFKI